MTLRQMTTRNRQSPRRPPRSRPNFAAIHYDEELMELSVGGRVIKRLDCRAVDQISILVEFEPRRRKRIDDPLPRLDGRDRKSRLKYVIR